MVNSRVVNRPIAADGTFQRAVALHRAGNLAEAARAYAAIVAGQPRNPDILLLYGTVLSGLGRHDEAVRALKGAIGVQPSRPDLQFALGSAFLAKGNPAEAVSHFREALKLRPTFAEAAWNLGHAHAALGQWSDARSAFARGAQLAPGNIALQLQLSFAARKLGRYDEAVSAARSALAVDPRNADALASLAAACKDAGRVREAVDAYRNAIASGSPDRALVHGLARSLLDLKPDEDAVRELRALVAAYPQSAGAVGCLGSALLSCGEIAEAEAQFRRAVDLEPTSTHAHQDLGNFLATTGRYSDAEAEFERVLAIDDSLHPARLNRGLMRLVTGDLERGWSDYEARLAGANAEDKLRFAGAVRWRRGMSLAGKTLFVHAEQGLGDVIQFIRYIPLFAAQGADVIVEVHPPLLPLLRGMSGVQRLIAQGEPVPPFHFHVPMLSLPLECGTRLDTIPPVVPLFAPSCKVEQWKNEIRSVPARRRVGVVWSGFSGHVNDRNRSIPLSTFRALLDAFPECHFFSLQKNPTPADAALLGTIRNVSNLGPAFVDFTDTAGAIENLDLVITVDTSVAHVAGTMGKPVWVLLPLSPDWRWLLGRSDSPWYPSATLFRQTAVSQWRPVLDSVVSQLRDWNVDQTASDLRRTGT